MGWDTSGNHFSNSAILPMRVVPTSHIPFLFMPKSQSHIFGDFPKSNLITGVQEKGRLSLWSTVSGFKRKTVAARQKAD